MFGSNHPHGEIHEVHREVSPPEVSCLRSMGEALVSLVLPRPIAFTVEPYTTRVYHFVFQPGESLHPVAFTASARRLFCYNAQFGDGSQSVVFVVGGSLAQAETHGGLTDVLSEIQEAARTRGGVCEHVLTSVNTPESLSCPREEQAIVRSRHHFKLLLHKTVWSDVVTPPHLELINVNLRSWSRLPCLCVFEGAEDSEWIRLRLQWGRNRDYETTYSLVPSTARPE
jgi:hypothetical protein